MNDLMLIIGVPVIFISAVLLFSLNSEPQAATYTPAEAEILTKLDQHIELLELMNRQCREIILPEMIRQRMSLNSETDKDNG